MKAQFRHAIHLLLAAMIVTMVGCTSDDDNVTKQNMPTDGYVKLSLRVAGENLTRADGWEDTPNATDDEMMNIWVVVVTNTDGSVVKCIACRPPEGHAENNNREIDEVGQILKGNYTVYSFANISVTDVCSFLGLTEPATIPEIGSTPVEIGVTGTVNHETVADKTATINGNLFNPTAADNGYGEKGIPMSNVQTITEDMAEKDLIVVRMLAKIEVQVFNDGEHDVTIESISLTDITANGNNNLKLLPNYGTTPDYPDDIESHHKDLQPNLGTAATKGNMTYITPAASRLVAHDGHRSTVEGQKPVTFTFYVNESVAPIDNASATTGNGTGLFYLSLGIKTKKTGTGEDEVYTDVVYTHALINQSGGTENGYDDGAWHYIARNDYRVIPVILSDWLFRVEPLAFVPIAGYPAVMLSSDAQKATFSTGGMIALQPFVKKRTDATWRDFDDPEVELVSIHWTNNDGDDQSDDGKIIKTAFAYDPYTKCIIGELNNNLSADLYKADLYKTAVTITVKLGPSTGPQYTYSFTCDVILDKRN